MQSKNILTIEQIEQKLLGWEKWLYACYSASFIMLAHAFIKNYENTILTGTLFFLEKQAGIIRSSVNFPMFEQYFYDLGLIYISPGRFLLWLIIQFTVFVNAAILAFHPTWRKVTLSKRLDLIFGYLLSGWVTFLSFGAQDPLNVGDGYSAAVVIYLLLLALGYWFLRRKKDKAEEVFP